MLVVKSNFEMSICNVKLYSLENELASELL
jgi:hypothetical protein